MSAYRFRVFLIAVLGLILLMFFLPVFARILNIGNLTGMVLSGALLLYVCNLPRIRRFVLQNPGSRWISFLRVVIRTVLILLAATALVETVLMIRACRVAPEPDSTLVVLGCQNGSRMMNSRVNAAADYLQEHPEAVCILSGGAGNDEAVPEAQYMWDWLVQKGIDPSRLRTEEGSTSTRENLQFSLDVARENGLSTDFAVVTNEFHQYRAALGAKKLGIRSGAVPADTPWWLFPTFYVRELYGILYEVFL